MQPTTFWYEMIANPEFQTSKTVTWMDKSSIATRIKHNIGAIAESKLEPYLNWAKDNPVHSSDNQAFFHNTVRNFHDRFEEFEVGVTHYKIVQNEEYVHPIEVFFLIPKATIAKKPAECKANVKWHGGGLVTGDAIFPAWFAEQFLELAKDTNTIIIAPNYRLLPEADGYDIRRDVQDFWKWFRDADFGTLLKDKLPKETEISKKDVLLTGESAGGGLAFYSWIECNAPIKVMYLQYPLLNNDYVRPQVPYMRLNLKEEDIEKAKEKLRKELNQHRANLPPRSCASPPDCMATAMMLARTRHLKEVFKKPYTFICADLKEKPANSPEKIILIHGKNDNIVPLKMSEDLVHQLEEELHWYSKDKKDIEFIKVPNVSHGFDYNVHSNGDDLGISEIGEAQNKIKTFW